MSDLDVVGILAPVLPQGPDSGASAKMDTIGQVFGVDRDKKLVQVSVHGSALWLPAVAGRYRFADTAGGGIAKVLLNPTTGRAYMVAGALDPLDPLVPGTLTALNTVTKRATVTVYGVVYTVPYLASTYGAPPVSVWVGLNDWGVPYFVHGPADDAPTGTGAPAVPPPPASGSATVTQTISPQWSGTYRTGSGWDRWNTTRYGGRSTLYQGNGFGSGPVKGLATYGDQFVNLGATSILSVRIMMPGVGLSGASGPGTVQGSPDGSQPGGAPSSSGDTATGAFDAARGYDVATLSPATREALRTGSVKGLALVGANYWAVAGAGNGDGMAAEVTYVRPA